MNKKEDFMKIFTSQIRIILSKLQIDFEQLQEIRLRIQSPLLILYQNKEFYVREDGTLGGNRENAYIISKNEIKETMEYISNYSLYAYEEEMKQGFITIQGGHRIGLAGKVIMEKDMIKSMKYISFINVRLSHQMKGCADGILPYMIEENNVKHTFM